MTNITGYENYLQTLEFIKEQVKNSQLKAHLSVNKGMLILYWRIGKTIIDRQKEEGWGTKITRKLSEDLTTAFPNMKGFSYTNINYMLKFSRSYADLLIYQQSADKLEDARIIPQTVAQNDGYTIFPQAAGKLENKIFYSDYASAILGIPWGHNREILDKVEDYGKRLWYAQKTIENGWSRKVLVTQINTNLYGRQATKENKTNNFALTLPQENSDLINEVFKDEYNFEFIENPEGRLKEKTLENALIDDIIKFLTELGKGFAFVGKQYHLEVDGQNFYCDLLFYHIKLKSYIIIELKTGTFKPEYVGKMGFYLACVDDYLTDDKDNYSIGIILCQDEGGNKEIKNKSLKCMMRPIGVSTYKLADKKELPEELQPLDNLKDLWKGS